MTFDDDFLQLHFLGGVVKILKLKTVSMTWPPPESIEFMGFPFERESMSAITDAQRKQMTHVCRGAAYRAAEQGNGQLVVPD